MGVLSLFHQYGVCSRSKKHKFQTKLDIENFRSILFWSENVDSGVKLDTSNLSNSQSNQNDLTHLIVLLIQFPKTSKSVWSKCPNDCFLEFDQTECQYIENWTNSLSNFVDFVRKVTRSTVRDTLQTVSNILPYSLYCFSCTPLVIRFLWGETEEETIGYHIYLDIVIFDADVFTYSAHTSGVQSRTLSTSVHPMYNDDNGSTYFYSVGKTLNN